MAESSNNTSPSPVDINRRLRADVFHQLVEKVRNNFNLPSIVEIVFAGPDRWKQVSGNIIRAIRGQPLSTASEKDILEVESRLKNTIDKCELTAIPPFTEIINQTPVTTFGFFLPPASEALLAIDPTHLLELPQPYRHISQQTDRQKLKPGETKLSSGAYLVLTTPTTDYKHEVGETFNNGVIVTKPNHPVGIYQEIANPKGAVAIAFQSDYPTNHGQLHLLSPDEVQREAKTPGSVLPHGGIILGTSIYHEVEKTVNDPFIRAVAVLEANTYTNSFNTIFSCLAEIDGQIALLYIMVDPHNIGDDPDAQKLHEIYSSYNAFTLTKAIQAIGGRLRKGFPNSNIKYVFLEENIMFEPARYDHQDKRVGVKQKIGAALNTQHSPWRFEVPNILVKLN